MAYANADDLLGGSVDNTEDVDLGNGRVIKVRGLSRYELILNVKGTEDALLVERRNISCCVVEPKLTEGQVEKWQKSSTPDVIGKVNDAIRRLSGLVEDADKSNLPSDGDES